MLGYLNEIPELRLTIIGHCDNLEVPSKRGRAALSLLRAKRARALLVQRGVSPERILVEGLGAESPDDDGDSAEARARNRRIEMEFRVEEQTPAPGL
jgi:flagellar motor protein MotB